MHPAASLDVKLSHPVGPGSGKIAPAVVRRRLVGLLHEFDAACGGRMKSNRRIEAEVDLGPSCDSYELAVRLKVSLPGHEPEDAQRSFFEANASDVG